MQAAMRRTCGAGSGLWRARAGVVSRGARNASSSAAADDRVRDGESGPLFGSIDQGTSSTRFILYDQRLRPLYWHQELSHSDTPKPGWVEQDARAIMGAVRTCMAQTMALAARHGGVVGGDVAGVGITNQRETTVVWDAETGVPLCPAIVWLDTRTQGVVDAVVADALGGDVDGLRGTTGLPLSPYFSASKLRWMLDNHDAVADAASRGTLRFGTVDTWVINQLGAPSLSGVGDGSESEGDSDGYESDDFRGGVGGPHVTDVTNASSTCLMDLATLAWSDRCIDAFGVPADCLPSIASSAEKYGTIHRGPLDGVPLTGCVGDQQAALVGQLCFGRGEVKTTYGTGAFMLMNTGTDVVQSQSGLLTTVAYKMGADAPTTYALEGSIPVAGVGIRWMQDNLRLFRDVKEFTELAAEVDGNDGVCFVPAFSGLLAPYWRPDARGVLVGLTHSTTRAHLCRAMLEAMAHQTADVVTAMEADSSIDVPVVKVDGGVSQSQLLLQLLADAMDKPVARPANIETTALGAAVAAAVGAGVYADVAAVAAGVSNPLTQVEASMAGDERSKWRAQWHDAVPRTYHLART